FLGITTFVLLGTASAALKYHVTIAAAALRGEIEKWVRTRITNQLRVVEWETVLSVRMGSVYQSLIADGWQTASGIDALGATLGSLGVVAVLFLTALVISPSSTLFLTLFFGIIGYVFVRLSVRNQRWNQQASRYMKVVSET